VSFNKAVLVGRLTRDPELSHTPKGHAVTTFGLAVDRWGKEKETDFFDIVVWGQAAETVSRFVSKGKMVVVDGRIQIDRYEKDGQKRTAWKIVANDVRFLGGGRQDDRMGFATPPPPEPPRRENQGIGGHGDNPGELPF